LYVTNIVVFLTALSTRFSLLNSKIHNGDYTPKDYQHTVSLLKFGRYPVVGTSARVCYAVTMCTEYLI